MLFETKENVIFQVAEGTKPPDRATVEGDDNPIPHRSLAFVKGDILIHPDKLGNSSFSNAALANPEMLWPSGMVEYKFYRSFPRCLNISFLS